MGSTAFAQNNDSTLVDKKVVHAGCSKCVFHSSKKCELAVKIDDKIYKIEGSSLKDHGKPRAKNGLCKTVREAEVTGKIENENIAVHSFKLLPSDAHQLPLLKENDEGKL